MPFNRAERDLGISCRRRAWTIPSPSARHQPVPAGQPIFANCPFPTLESDRASTTRCSSGPTARALPAPSFFNVSGMSYGSLSQPAMQALSQGCEAGQCWLNTGEGGPAESPRRQLRSRGLQIGTAKYGVRDDAGRLSRRTPAGARGFEQMRMFELKLSQGADPGKGGILPGAKVTPEIAEDPRHPGRAVTPSAQPPSGGALSIGDLLDMIAHIREVSGQPIGFKAVIGACAWLDALFRVVMRARSRIGPRFHHRRQRRRRHRRGADALIDNVGLLFKECLPIVVQLCANSRPRTGCALIAIGQIRSRRSTLAWALCVGADFDHSAPRFHVCARLHPGAANATAIPVRPASPRTTDACSAAWSRPTRPSAWRATHGPCGMRSASSRIPAACRNRADCSAITAASCRTTGAPCRSTRSIRPCSQPIRFSERRRPARPPASRRAAVRFRRTDARRPPRTGGPAGSRYHP